GDTTTINTNGLRNVGIGQYVYVTGADHDEAEETVTGWAWTLSGPPGSGAALEFTSTGDSTGTTPRTFGTTESQFGRFRTDVPGIYAVGLTVTTATATQASSIDVYAGTYVGQAACASCHDNPAVVGVEKAVYSDYMLTGHATKFQLSFGYYSASSDYCMPCHTTAYDESGSNGGFDDMMEASGWNPAAMSVGAYLDANYANIGEFLSDTSTMPAQTVMNIQCEACHGPGSNHPPADAHMSWWPGNCKQCHPQPNEWALSAHAKKPEAHMGGSSGCSPCHTGQGFVVGMDQGKDLVFPNDAAVGMTANMFEPGNAQPIGCAACHDPHGFTHPFDGGGGVMKSHQLRFVGEVDSPAGFSTDAEYAAGCYYCHSNKRDAAYFADYVAGNKSRGPHHNGQADILEGEGGYEYTGETYGTSAHAALTSEKCVDCHMNTGSGADCSSTACTDSNETCSHGHCVQTEMGGHTFNMSFTDTGGTTHQNLYSCNTSSCHSGLTTFDRQPPGATGDGWDCDSTTTGIQSEIANMLDAIETCLITTNTFLDDGTGALKSSGFNDTSVTDAERGAIWNYVLVEGDGSHGVHNPKYAMQLLRDSYDDLGCTPALTCTRP
ncbi:MAG: hypothetical protein JRG91_02520, partial [Deltaproteobacteria bacterium]|nr:hypothetical protein [Deltaproteobacteria bacterium]